MIAGLGILSWVATYVGMLELIEANMGDLPIVHRMIIGFSVAMLMIMIIWLLDQMFKPHPFSTKLIYASGYIFLSLISVGFGFGFYWKVLESRGEASRSAESAVGQVQNSLQAASTRLEQLQATLMQLTAVSNEKAELERTKGTSCPNSKPGDGPRRKMRDEDAQRFTFASDFVKGRVGSVKAELSALDGDLLKITSADASTFDPKTGTRNEFMRGLGRKLDLTVTGFNAFRTDPQLRQIRTDLSDRAERSTVADGRGGTISCPDAQLQTALRGVVKAIDQLPELTKPEIAAVEGSEATIEAFRRLTTTFYGLLAFKMPPSADELRELQKKAIQSVEGNGGVDGAPATLRALGADQGGLSKRDYVPLAVAVFVDLCLLLVSMVQRPNGRLDGLVPKMQAAERGPVIQILSRFNEIHRDQHVRENFEIFRHVVFDMHGDYYVAVPLNAPPRLDPEQRDALQIEAQLLGNLFASFEKEKIFKRTMLPTTGSIQRRLARQGSKFAGSEAFRVYKFSDGAWSDIILGAVMGAARRIEDSERMAPTIGHAALPVEPDKRSTVMPPARHATLHGEDVHEETMHGATRYGEALRDATGGMGDDVRPFNELELPPPSILNMPPSPLSPRAKRQNAERPHVADITSLHRRDQAVPSLDDVRHRAASAPGGVDREHASRFGPYATAYPPPPPFAEPDVTVVAANSNTARTASMVAEPVADQGHARVTLSRDTATMSLPVSEAVMPASLREALERMVSPNAFMTAQAHTPAGDRMTSERHNEIITSDEFAANDDGFTVDDLAIISRIAPPAAE